MAQGYCVVSYFKHHWVSATLADLGLLRAPVTARRSLQVTLRMPGSLEKR